MNLKRSIEIVNTRGGIPKEDDWELAYAATELCETLMSMRRMMQTTVERLREAAEMPDIIRPAAYAAIEIDLKDAIEVFGKS